MESRHKRRMQRTLLKEDSPPKEVPAVQYCSDRRNYNMTVDSLQTVCIKFVAKNIFIVESLCNFPDVMGEEIFKRVQSEGLLKNWNDKSVKVILRLFSDGYQESLLYELNLSKFPRLLLEDCMDFMSQFVYLKKLDVSDQQLGDTHQLWQAVGEMRNLTHLILKNNLLSDKGLQHLTLPSRMFQRGPLKLHVLSLACNPGITDSGVRYLMCFKDLRHLDVSGTKIKIAGLKQIEEKLLLRSHPTYNSEDKLFMLRDNQGWAADVINGWITEYESSHRQMDNDTRSDNESLFCAKKFYSRKNDKPHMARVFRDLFTRVPCPPAEPCLRLASYKNNMTAGGQGTRRLPLRQHNATAAIDLSKRDNVNELTEWQTYCHTDTQSQNAVIMEPKEDCDLSTKYVATKRSNDSSFTGLMNECSEKLDNSDMLSAYQKSNSLWSAMNSDKW